MVTVMLPSWLGNGINVYYGLNKCSCKVFYWYFISACESLDHIYIFIYIYIYIYTFIEHKVVN